MPDQKPNAIAMYVRCGQCGGTGKISPIEGPDVDCPECSAIGYHEVYQIDLSDVIDTINDIKDRCNDIYEKVNE